MLTIALNPDVFLHACWAVAVIFSKIFDAKDFGVFLTLYWKFRDLIFDFIIIISLLPRNVMNSDADTWCTHIKKILMNMYACRCYTPAFQEFPSMVKRVLVPIWLIYFVRITKVVTQKAFLDIYTISKNPSTCFCLTCWIEEAKFRVLLFLSQQFSVWILFLFVCAFLV